MKKATYLLLLAVYGGLTLLGSGGLHTFLEVDSCHLGACQDFQADDHGHGDARHCCHQPSDQCPADDGPVPENAPRHDHNTCAVCQWAGQGQRSAVEVQLPRPETLILGSDLVPPCMIVQPIRSANLSRGPPLSCG